MRASQWDSDDEEFAEPVFDEQDYTGRGLPPPIHPDLSENGFSRDRNGWTHLVMDGRVIRSYKDSSTPSSLRPNVTLGDVVARYEDVHTKWKESKDYKRILQTFKKQVLGQIDVRVDRCVIVGLGTFTGSHPNCNGDNRPMHQLALLETVLQVMRR